MASTKIKLNHGGMKALLNSDEIGDFVEGKAKSVLTAAQSGAPVATGEYRNSLHIERVHTDRVVARVVSDAPHAFVVEARTGNLARAIDAAGGS